MVHHQPSPFEYLSRLLQLSEEVSVIRIRTRDSGATVLDPELSCQRIYDQWVPFMVLNVGETIDAICSSIPVERMFVVKHYVQLGGWHNRFLPKECYDRETGTAETAVYIVRSQHESGDPNIVGE